MGGSGAVQSTPGDEGFSLMEVVVAMFVFSLLSLGVLATLDGALGLTRSNQGRVVAANLAAKAIEVARDAQVTSLDDGPPVSESVTVDGTTFTVVTAATYVASVGATSACDGPAGRVMAQRVNVSVTWPGMGDVAPVRSDTLRPVDADAVTPALGTLAVRVRDAEDEPVSGRVLTLTPGTGLTATTDASGCAVFSGLSPRNDYVVTDFASGQVNRDGESPPRRSPLVVRAKELTFAELWSAAGGSIGGAAPTSGFPVPSTMTQPLTMNLFHNGLRAGSKTVPCSFSSCTSGPLFPFATPYSVDAVYCNRSGSMGEHVVTAGQHVTAGGPVGALRVRLRSTKSGGSDAQWDPKYPFSVVDGCGVSHNLGTRRDDKWRDDNGSYNSASLPVGTYTLRYMPDDGPNEDRLVNGPVVTITHPAPTSQLNITVTYIR